MGEKANPRKKSAVCCLFHVYMDCSMNIEQSDHLIVKWVSGGLAICLFPFIVLRAVQEDWLMAMLNMAAVSLSTAIFFHVYISNKTKLARFGLSILASVVLSITVYFKGISQVVWIYPTITLLFFLLSPKQALVMSLSIILSITLFSFAEANLILLAKFIVSSSATMFFCFAFSTKMRLQAKKLSQMALLDNLTGAGNRRALDSKLSEVTALIKRYPQNTCSLVIFDLDHFKSINDNFGHVFGDTVLNTFVKVLKGRIRSSDYVYRYGGEEFVVLLEHTDVVEAMSLAKELGNELERIQWDIEKVNVTVSSGVAQFLEQDTIHSWLQKADTALYKAKQAGRNCCVAHDSDAVAIVRQMRIEVA